MHGTSDNVVLVFDLETVPDVQAFAAAEGLDGHPDWSVRRQMGEKVARQVFQRIVCIGSLLAMRSADGVWRPSAVEAPHAGGASERELIQDFVDRLLPLAPRLITFNGHTFDLPVLRYRAMMHSVAAPALAVRPYFDRGGDDMVDLCDLLSAQERHARVSLNELARVLGLPGKPSGVDGGKVEAMVQEGRLADVADYCKSDVVNTFRAWLRYELFCGRLSEPQFAASETTLSDFLTKQVLCR
jgi:predicted PolB exonuclease-like 3'-5' exonuclease